MTDTLEKQKDCGKVLTRYIKRCKQENRNNLTIEERKAIREISNYTKLKVYQFDKEPGFAIMKKEETIKK